MTTVDFPQGVPDGCIIWLEQHVGPGQNPNYGHSVTREACAWYYERRYQPHPEQARFDSELGSYIPSITVKDSDKAVLFALRWSGT